MDSVVLQLCYDGWWEMLADGSMEYVNGNNTAFLIRKDCTFDQFLARVYDVLQINRNEYNITMKTTLRSSNTMYRTCSLPMDIFNDEIVKVVLHMASDVVNYGCIPIFVTTSSRVDYQDLEPPVKTETSFRANVSVPDSEEEVLPQTLSLQQRYSPLHGYNDTINDNGITLADVEAEALPQTLSLEQRYSPSYNNEFRSNDDPIDDIGNTAVDNVCMEPYNNTTDNHFNSSVCDGGVGPSHIPTNVDDDDQNSIPINNIANQPIPSVPRSRRRTTVDHLAQLAPVLPSNLAAPNLVRNYNYDDISVGKLFVAKNELILQLRKVALRGKFDFRITRSTTTHFEAQCSSELCKWRIRATRVSNEQNVPWLVRRVDNVHTCCNEVLAGGVHQEYGVQLTYQQAYRAKEVGLEIVRGNPTESYNLLLKYSHVLTKANEGTVTHLRRDGNDNFLYYFVAIGSSIKGFMQCMRPMIAMDGTHLKGLYRGTMFVATCPDGNNQLYLLAIGVMDSENNDAWEWFMTKLHRVIGDMPELVFISDRCTAIKRAVLKVFHSASHGVCFYHVKGRRYSILTTNIAESVNSLLRGLRKFPITHLVDHFRKILQQWFYDRKITAELMSTRLTTWADEIVSDRRTLAERMIVRPVAQYRFHVLSGGIKEGIVDIREKTCSCRVFQLDQLVCAHAIAAFITVRVDYISLCSEFYTQESLVTAYAQPVEPVGDMAD
ncbi:SWIM-type domain-containing protein [Citrus sinensis]|nr:SWIM-type domain-containing protein [Citrus sinensis]